jgi:hypothetical protein
MAHGPILWRTLRSVSGTIVGTALISVGGSDAARSLGKNGAGDLRLEAAGD